MKKFSVLILVGLFVLASGTMVYAQQKEEPKLEFKASGFLEICTFWNRNVPPNSATQTIFGASSAYTTPRAEGVDGKAYNKTVSYIDERASLKFDAIMGKNLSGTIAFEIDSSAWGDTPGGQGGKISERGTSGYWGGDRASVEVKHIYFDVLVPENLTPAPTTARIGVQALSIRPGMFLYTDGAGIKGTIKANSTVIEPLWFKALEGTNYTNDDIDVYGLHLNSKIDSITLGAYGVYYSMQTYPLFVTSAIAGLPSSLNPLVQGTLEANFWWLGLYADGPLGPFNINFDFVYDTGKVKSRLTPGTEDVDYDGWATRAKVDYPYEKFNFGMVGMYATGADKKKTSAAGLPGETVAYTGATTSKVKSFVVPPMSEAGPIFGGYLDSVVFYNINASSTGGTGWASGLNANQVNRGPTGGTWFAKLYGSYKLTPDHKVTLQTLYIGDTTKNGNTFGTAVKGDGNLRDDKQIGWELDLINEIYVYKNLRWLIGAGVLFAGDAMDMKKSGVYSNDGPKNPWQLTTRLTYTF